MTPLLIAAIVQSGGDTIELRPSSEGHVAEVHYRNSVVQNSLSGIYTMELGDVRVQVHVIVTGGDEILIVRPKDETLIAVPDRIDVADGEETVVQIMRPMF
jgi:hypothetical protein